MKGPGFDLGGLMSGFMAPPQPANRPVATKPPKEDDELSDIVSQPADEDTKDISISTGEKKTKGKPKKKEVVLNL